MLKSGEDVGAPGEKEWQSRSANPGSLPVALGCVRVSGALAPHRRAGPVDGGAPQVCIGNVSRDWRYGLNYYAVTPLPDCETEARPLQVLPAPGDRVYLGAVPE